MYKVLDTPLSEGDEPATLPVQRDPGHSVQMEGYLGRKHDLEGPNKKASNRCVCRGREGGQIPGASMCGECLGGSLCWCIEVSGTHSVES